MFVHVLGGNDFGGQPPLLIVKPNAADNYVVQVGAGFRE